jgi:hypothetical protein
LIDARRTRRGEGVSPDVPRPVNDAPEAILSRPDADRSGGANNPLMETDLRPGARRVMRAKTLDEAIASANK